MSEPTAAATTTTTHRVQPYELEHLDARIAEGSVDVHRLAATLQNVMADLEQVRETATAAANWINAKVQAETQEAAPSKRGR